MLSFPMFRLESGRSGQLTFLKTPNVTGQTTIQLRVTDTRNAQAAVNIVLQVNRKRLAFGLRCQLASRLCSDAHYSQRSGEQDHHCEHRH